VSKFQSRRSRLRVGFPVLVAIALAAAGCAPSSMSNPAGARSASDGGTSALPARSPGDELYELSPARVQIRRLAPQALRLLAPHWSRVRESDRKTLQSTLIGTFSETRVTPFVRAKLTEAAAARPDMAALALVWLRSPLGYEVKFAEATAASGDKASEASFYADVANMRENRTPEIRMERIRRLSEATGALQKTLDLTASVGTVVARLVNVSRPDSRPLAAAALEAAVRRERQLPEVAVAYTPVVNAALLVRCRDLDLDEVDQTIAFASTDAGRWYYDTLAAALISGVQGASMDVEGVFEANAHSDKPAPNTSGFDLDSLLVELPSGRSVRLLALAQAGPEAQPAVVLRYETSLPLADGTAIGVEAGQVWEKLRGQIESDGALAAVLQATGSVDGWVFPYASSRKFGWRREQGGNWTAVTGEKAAYGTLAREMLWSLPP